MKGAAQKVVSKLGTFFERPEEVQTNKTYTSFEFAIQGMPEGKYRGPFQFPVNSRRVLPGRH